MTELANKYQYQNEHEHVLKNPSMYIGSTAPTLKTVWTFDDESFQILPTTINFHDGLFKLLDEALTNAYDHASRSATGVNPVTMIKIDISPTKVSFFNDGESIDVEKHPKLDIYIPEMIFGRQRTSTNYHSNRAVGGVFGLGIKLVSIFSTRARIEIVDFTRKLSYTQTFTRNLSEIGAPVIKPIKRALKSGTTFIEFEPEFARFGLTEFPSYMAAVLKKRAYDLSILVPSIKIYFNGKALTKRTFKNYITLCLSGQKYALFESARWKIALTTAENGFYCLSLANGIQTLQGGIHVTEAIEKIITGIQQLLKEKKKPTIHARILKEYISLFVSTELLNPEFIGQVKESLCKGKFLEQLHLTPEFIETAYKLIAPRAIERTAAMQEHKKRREIQKLVSESNGIPRATIIRGVPELSDANWAGTRKSDKCILIICEGESASSGVLSGLSSDARNVYGVYPIRGKLINPRDKSADKIAKDKIIIDLKKILGLEAGRTYVDAQKLRYGRIIFVTDQDKDGHHIKGLGINLFSILWPSLLRIPNFMGFIQTPIIKARCGHQEICFYYDYEYENWKKTISSGKWTIKYFKGLGTSTPKEFKEYFKNPRIIYFENTTHCNTAILTAFGKDTEARKSWLANYERDLSMKIMNDKVSYGEFIHKELIHFSKYDCDRSIPAIDGLKTSQRKILFVALKTLLNKEAKIAQFCGHVANITHYHHAETSLEKTAIGMAQNFVGSNNINLLLPNGQFGTRLLGGEDAAAARYLFTSVHPITKFIYRTEDEVILDLLEDDGTIVEPRFYYPIIPMILVNGACGIGTGFSCSVLPHAPLDVLEEMEAVVRGSQRTGPFLPYFKGFLGTVKTGVRPGYYTTEGCFKLDRERRILHITELPIGMWTRTFKEFLEDLCSAQIIESHVSNSTDISVDFEIVLSLKTLEACNTDDDILKMFKLSRSHHETNMYLFNFEDKLVKFDSPRAIIQYYYPIRLAAYKKRKQCIIGQYERMLKIAQNKVRYVRAIVSAELPVFKPKKDIIAALNQMKFDMFDDSYAYLLKMPIDSLCIESVLELEKRYDLLAADLESIKHTTTQTMWLNELEELRQNLTALDTPSNCALVKT